MKVKRILFLFCVVGFIGWCLWSCEPIRSYSKIPEIHFKRLVFEDKPPAPDLSDRRYAVITFSFVDGDGNIGRSPQDTDSISRVHYIWEKKLPEGIYEPYQFQNESVTSAEIPYDKVMNKVDAYNKILKGTIDIEIEAPTEIQDIDTMRIGFYIVDRSRNKSNIDYTPDFSIQDPPTQPITK